MAEALIPHLTEIKVRGYHLDLYGHVHHSRYLEFLEEAAWRCIEKYGSIEFLVNAKLAFVIVHINYRRAATIGEDLVLETAMRDIGTKNAIMRHVVKSKGTTSVIADADADVTFVIVGGVAGGWPLAVFAFVFGIFYGGWVALGPALVADSFGGRNVSGIIGILYTSLGVGTLIGPSAAGFAFAVSRSYLVPILASAAGNVLAAIILVLVTRKTADLE